MPVPLWDENTNSHKKMVRGMSLFRLIRRLTLACNCRGCWGFSASTGTGGGGALRRSLWTTAGSQSSWESKMTPMSTFSSSADQPQLPRYSQSKHTHLQSFPALSSNRQTAAVTFEFCATPEELPSQQRGIAALPNLRAASDIISVDCRARWQ